MKNFAIAFLCGILGYMILAGLSYYLVGKFSSSQDRSVEASMTSIFVYGPIGFILMFIAGYVWIKNYF